MYVICRIVLSPKSCLFSTLIFIYFLLQPSCYFCVNSLYIFDSKQIGLKYVQTICIRVEMTTDDILLRRRPNTTAP